MSVAEARRDKRKWANLRNAVRRNARRLPEIFSLPRFDNLDPEAFRTRAREGLPFIVTGLVDRWPLAKLTRAELRERFGELRAHVRSRDYAGEKAFTAKRTMTEMSLVDYLARSQAETTELPPYLGNQRLAELSELCHWPAYFTDYKEPSIWLGPPGTVTPLHCDYYDNLFAQIWGRKRFILFPPHCDDILYTRQANQALYASRFDPETPDFDAFPRAREAKSVECIVEPGDLLFVPAGWFHHVRALEFSLSANRWADDRPNALYGDLSPMGLEKAADDRNALSQTAEWKALQRHIYARAITFGDDILFDFREMLTYAGTLELAGRLMWQLVKPFSPAVLVGPGYGSAPLLSAIALAARAEKVNLNVLMVREARKKHHMKKWVEGRRQPPGTRALFVDDFMNNGSALPLVEKALEADRHSLDIVAAALFFDMWQPLGSRQISVSRFPVVSLFRRHDLGLTRDCFDARPPQMKGDAPEFIERRQWWRFDLNKKTEYPWKSAPVIAEGAVFAADDHCNVWRHALEDGSIEWKYESLADPPKGIVQLLQYADNSLVFGCYDGTVTRLDARTGEVVWRVRQDSSIHSTPAVDVAGGRVFINTEQWNNGAPLGSVIALDWADGRLLWQHRHRYWSPGTPFYSADDGVVVATSNDRSMVCVDAATGERRWRFRTHGLVRGQPVVTHGRAYAGTESGRLHCIDLASGEEVWTIRYGAGHKHAFVLAHLGCVYLFDGKWHLTAFDALTGELRWVTRLRSEGSWCPVPCGRYLVALSREGHLAVLDPERELKLWEDSIGGTYRQPPAIADGFLAAASNDQGLKTFKLNPHYLQ